MNRETMLKRLKAGYDPIDVSIKKWQDIRDEKGEDKLSLNCALCETHPGCIKCPLGEDSGMCCHENSVYKQYHYHPTKQNAQHMIDALQCVKCGQKKEFKQILMKITTKKKAILLRDAIQNSLVFSKTTSDYQDLCKLMRKLDMILNKDK